MKRLTHVLSLATVVLATLGSHTNLAGQTQGTATTRRAPVDVSKLGPQVGQTVPDFTLSDQHGNVWTLASVMGPEGAMLVFYRSADW